MSYWSLAIFLLGVAGIASIPNDNRIIRFVGIGFDALEADPDSTTAGGADPGYKPTNKIFAIDSNASQVEQFPRETCQNITTWRVVYDEKSYQSKFDIDVSFSSEVDTPIFKTRFGLSGGYHTTQQETTKERNVLYDEESVCNYGQGRIRGIKRAMPDLKFTEDYQQAVCKLPTTYDKNAYLDFLKFWGTHVVIRVNVGTRQTNRTEIKLNSFMEKVTDQVTAGVVASGSVSVVSAELQVDMSKFDASANFYEELTGETSSKQIGTKELPEPIGAEVMSLDQVLIQRFFGADTPCTADQLNNLAAIKTNVIQALADYPTNRGVSPPTSDGIIKSPFNFPLGTYGLYSVRGVGCPNGSWSSGWRYQDCEDHNNQNDWSSPLHVAGTVGNNIQTDFCIKEHPSFSDFDMKWPRGEYCVLKYRNCPEGFREGYVYWDDEDTGTTNKLGGIVPDGTYDDDTEIYYCCREDGHMKSSIFLPTTSSFILLPANKYGCQEVNGMKVTKEWIKWDTADLMNHNDASDVSPYVELDDNEIKLFFCYYEKI